MLKITAYADRLLDDLDKLDWPEKVKKMQTEWIGKSYGAEVDFKVDGREEAIKVYTTRPDTLYGATFMVLAPEHELAAGLAVPETKEAVEKYIYEASMKSNVDRLQDKEKTGVFTGSYAVNPLMVRRCRSGFLTMCWPITAREPSCAYRLTTTETLSLQRNSIFRLSRLLRKTEWRSGI